ncbi:hypothetical protein NC651_019000 [Populus alba x Populus x berolinensis]|nr:hypothetical protein NC651_019000 [Populus alba x Populus x berolinensis]
MITSHVSLTSYNCKIADTSCNRFIAN